MEEGKFPEKEGGRNTVYTLLGKKLGWFVFFFKRSACHPFPNELKIFLLFNQCEIKTAVNRIKEADFLGSQWLREQIDGLSCRLGLPSFCISIRVF